MELSKGTAENQDLMMSPTEILGDEELTARIQRLSERTSLSAHDLLVKWLLQEETLLSVIRGTEGNMLRFIAGRTDDPNSDFDWIPEELMDADAYKDPEYRKKILKNIKKFRKEGKTFTQIAAFFNTNGVPTLSGAGQWYPSSVSQLLKAGRPR
ncbi:MAG: recombinase family protein [Synergistaceae bacterium]|jgi:hypothetical protein|nr:recombinase family protein [Synergistaceae bacterium]